MKLSIVISTQPAKFAALAFKGNLEQNTETIKSLGYTGIELTVRDPKLLDLPKIKALTIDQDFPVSAIGTGQAFGEEGLSFSDPDRNIRRKAIDRIKSQVELATELNSLVIIGLIRGIVADGADMEQANQWIIEALDECASVNPDVKLAIEPCNRYEANTINSVDQGLSLLKDLGKENVGLLLDTFHMNIEEPDIYQSIENADQQIFHFHIADSNRWYPGAGHLDFPKIVSKLEAVNYNGFLSAEILPFPDGNTSAEKTIQFMTTLKM
jgi:sugar phosphate isomerase/epimerase